jgi:hypothetical protein
MRWVVSFTLRTIYPMKEPPGTHCIDGWEGPVVGIDAVAKKKIPSPCRESNLRTPIFQAVASGYTDKL